jgi:hypothetical protein
MRCWPFIKLYMPDENGMQDAGDALCRLFAIFTA